MRFSTIPSLIFVHYLIIVPSFSYQHPTEWSLDSTELSSIIKQGEKFLDIHYTKVLNSIAVNQTKKTQNKENDGSGSQSTVNFTTHNDFSNRFSAIHNFLADKNTTSIKYNILEIPRNISISLQAQKQKAEINENIKPLATESNTDLNSLIDDLDNVTYSVFINRESAFWGSRLHKLQNEFVTNFFVPSDAILAKAKQRQETEIRGALSQQLVQLAEFSSQNLLTEYNSTKKEIIMQLGTIHSDWKSYISNEVYRSIKLEDIAKLIANNPQLYIKLSFNDKNKLVGQQESSAKIYFEYPVGKSFSKLYRKLNNIDLNPEEKQRLLMQYSNINEETLNKNRLLFSFEYRQLEEYDFSFLSRYLEQPFEVPDPLDKTDVLCGQLAMGGPFGGNSTWRYDVSATYEDYEDDPTRNDKLIADLAFTFKGSNNVQYPLTFRYVSNPDDIGPVDHKYSARFGIRWRTLQDVTD